MGKPGKYKSPRLKPGQKKERNKPFRGGKGRAGKSGSGKEVLYGFHSVYEALRAGRRKFESVFLSDKRSDPRVEKVALLAADAGVPVENAPPETLERLAAGGNHQGICARVSAFPVRGIPDIWTELRDRETPFFILIVESIEDPHNLGALIRTALCADVDYIVIPKDRSALPSPGVSRSSAGAMEHADIFMATNLASLMRDLKEEGAWISGLDAGGDKSLFEAELTGNLALVVGGEHKGIRPGVRKECDFILSIPISGKINSLNASVAGGIAMYEAKRQRLLVN
ncbi:MAG: 23S rRNA (guanosine(2251)-2'-O)-methyltransferase RlmB [Desulfobacterales bacterium]|nr:23S rRNA (guanosine(2251)-2'-O)-methyltransferase RlmB [Desulfobacterales bacterium]